MSEKRKKYDREFREGAVRIVRETGKSIAQVARDLGIHEGTLGNWVAQDREAREGRGELTRDDLGELKRLRSERGTFQCRPEGPTPGASYDYVRAVGCQCVVVLQVGHSCWPQRWVAY